MWRLQATKKVATLALKIKDLKAFVHVSTAYVNCNLPRGSHIEEQIYPLRHKDGKKVEHKKLAIKLAAMAPAKAEAEVRSQSYPGKFQRKDHQPAALIRCRQLC